MKTGKWLALVAAAAVVAGVGWVMLGGYDVAADVPHWRLTERLLETVRERSIERRSEDIVVPPLDDEAAIRAGAGNYDAMCADCHLRPGEESSELKKGLNPSPPDLSRRAHDPKESFWVIRHGIKMTGMPAWAGHMDEEASWQIVALLQRLPELSAEEYQALVAASGGHSHGEPESAAPAAGHEAGEVHAHADGTKHVHHDTDAGAGPAAAVDRFYAALSKGDLATVKSLLDEKALVLESGGAEHSAAEYLAGHAKDDAAFLMGARQRVARRTARVDGNLAWVASEGSLSATPDGKAVELATGETMVLKKDGDGWKIVHIHWSSHAKQ